MELSLKEVKERGWTEQDILVQYQVDILKLYENFSYLAIKRDVYRKIVESAISNTLSYQGKDQTKPYLYFLRGFVTKKLFAKVRLQKRTQDDLFQVFDRYIHQKFQKTTDYSVILKYFQKLEFLCDAGNLLMDPSILMKLLEKNEVFQSMLDTVFQKNRATILAGEMESIVTNSLLLNAMYIYFEVRGIEFIEEKGEDENPNEPGKKGRLLTRDEEIELAKRIEQGDKRARDALIEANFGLVRKVANRYSHTSPLPYEDIVQNGMLGLIKAADLFDYRKNCRFSTHATWWIWQSIQRENMNTSNMIRIPVHKKDEQLKLLKVRESLMQKLGRDVTIDELVQETGYSDQMVQELLSVSVVTSSLDSPISEEGNHATTLGDMIPSQDDDMQVQEELLYLQKHISLLLDQTLTPREKFVICERFGVQTGVTKTLEEVGYMLNVTRERVRQVEEKALYKLSKKMKNYTCYMSDIERAEKLAKMFRSIGTFEDWKAFAAVLKAEEGVDSKKRKKEKPPRKLSSLPKNSSGTGKQEDLANNHLTVRIVDQQTMEQLYVGQKKQDVFEVATRITTFDGVVEERPKEEVCTKEVGISEHVKRGRKKTTTTVQEVKSLQQEKPQKKASTVKKASPLASRTLMDRIYVAMEQYSKDQVFAIISTLSPEDKSILERPTPTLTQQDLVRFYERIVPEVNQKLSSFKSVEEKQTSQRMQFGKISQLEEDRNKKIEAFSQQLASCQEQSILGQVLTCFQMEDALLLSLGFGLLDGHEYGLEELTALLGVDSVTIQKRTKALFQVCKQKLNQSIEDLEHQYAIEKKKVSKK